MAKTVHDNKTWAEIGWHFPGRTMQALKENFKKQEARGKAAEAGAKPRVRAGGA